tara:strand:- start:2878 stop:3576 length:699 start_codon:yes stop_codon:yes gene_type:complete
MTEEQLPKVATDAPSPFDAENPTELDKQDNEEYLAAMELAKKDMAEPYERKLTDEDLPPDIDKIQKGGIGTAMELDKRDQIDDFLDDLMKGDARVDIPIPNSADGDEIDWEWIKYCFEDNQEAHVALNQCIEVLHKRLEGMEKYLGEMERPERIMQEFMISPEGRSKFMTLQENFDALHTKMESFEARLDGVIHSRVISMEQQTQGLSFLIGALNKRVDSLEGKTDGVQPTE